MANFASIKKNWRLALLVATAIVIVAGIVGYRVRQNSEALNTGAAAPTVSLIAIKDYLQPAAITLDNGTVGSVSQADLRAQVSSPITQVDANLGDGVSAGQVIAAQKNDDLKAQLAQAQANLETAQTGDRPEDLAISQTQADQAKTALASAINDAYAKADDTIKNHIDKFFANPETANLQFFITIDAGAGGVIQFGANESDAQRRVEIEKVSLIAKMNDWEKSIADPVSIETNLSLAKSNLNYIIDFLNDMSAVANSLTSDSATYKQILDGYKTELSASRATISGTLSSLQGTETAWRIAAQTLALKQAGSTPEQLKLAQAAVDALTAQVEKTYIRAPFPGKISFLDAKIGELASPGQLVATVVNPGALQITTYASENDLPNIAIGDKVIIGGDSAAGIVSRVSPAIDPTTKKAQLIVSVANNDPDSPIIIGQTVTLQIQSKKLARTTPVYLLPIQAVRSNSEDFIYTVDQNNKVQQVPVTTHGLVGESIEVTGNLAPDLKIISSVSGLSAGDKVKIQ